MKRFVVPFVALLAAAVLGGVASVGLWEAVDDDAAPVAATATTTVNRPVAVRSGSVADIYEATIPGVVEITAQTQAPGQPGAATATGSGWVLDSEGRIDAPRGVADGDRDARRAGVAHPAQSSRPAPRWPVGRPWWEARAWAVA